tara:strand:+ start:957 stop:1460 length:504 start_codon:yes stop_codon:yes gene_type:complete
MVHPINKTYAKEHGGEYQEKRLITHCLPLVLPRETDKIYIVRISSPAAVNDYRIMIKRIEENGIAEWDSDKQNRISIGDWLGFILGDTHEAIVELFKVVDKKGTKHRPSHWNSKKYTYQKVNEDVQKRQVIYFSEKGPEISWNFWKKKVNYSEIYMPRGTIKAKNPY